MEGLWLSAPLVGNAYDGDVQCFPGVLREALDALDGSVMLRTAMGDLTRSITAALSSVFDEVVARYERERILEYG